MTLVSIDWDFFVEECPMLDLGHREQSIFLTTMWDIRRIDWAVKGRSIQQMMPLRSPVNPFDAHLVAWMMVDPGSEFYSANAESHGMIVPWLDDCDDVLDVWNFDAHHDVNYGTLRPDKYDCSNWLGWLMQQGRVRQATQVYPLWRCRYAEGYSEAAELAAKAGTEYRVVYGVEQIRTVEADAVFLCRSGCWTPPEYDSMFNDLCRALGHTICLKERGTDLDEALKGLGVWPSPII